ncbi:MAG TPA: hypothetical protein VF338_00995 [Leptolinea sp.]
MSLNEPTGKLVDIAKIMGIIAGGITGATAIFVIIGFIIILSFAQSVGIYGQAGFANQLHLEALFNFVFDGLRFIGSNNLNWGFLAISLLFLCVIANSGGKPSLQKNVFRYASIITLIIMAVQIGAYDVYASVANGNWRSNAILYIVCVPLLISLCFYLVLNYQNVTIQPDVRIPDIQTADKKNEQGVIPEKNNVSHAAARRNNRRREFSEIALWFVLLLVFAPFFYGARIYDLDLLRIVKLQCSDRLDTCELVRRINAGGMMSTYSILGRALDKSMVFGIVEGEPKITMINNSDIKLLEVSSQKKRTMRGNRRIWSVRSLMSSVTYAPDEKYIFSKSIPTSSVEAQPTDTNVLKAIIDAENGQIK